MIKGYVDYTPEVYTAESRDFQLLCRLLDSAYISNRYSSQTILNALTASKVSNRLLSLLADRVGFKTNKLLDDNVLRYIVSAFPYVIKNKGTLLGVRQAVITILKAENSLNEPYVSIDPKDSSLVIITTPITIYNREALDEFLKYILPTGYGYSVRVGQKIDTDVTTLETIDRARIVIPIGREDGKDKESGLAIIRNNEKLPSDAYEEYNVLRYNTPQGEEDDNDNAVKDRLVGAHDTLTIVKGEQNQS